MMIHEQPIVNQIIAEHSRKPRVVAKELITVDVDRIYVQDGNSPTIAKLFRQHNLKRVLHPEKIGFFFDHSVIVPDKLMAERVNEAMEFAKSIGVNIFTRGEGISHLIALEEQWFQPGNIVIGADSHTCTGGAVQSLALGMGASDVLAAMLTGQTWLKVPETVSLSISGQPHPATRTKDVMLALLRHFGQSPFLYRSVELCGEWSQTLSLDSAASFASMGVELGAKCVFMPDGPGRPANMRPINPEVVDHHLTFSLSELTPHISLPHSPAQAVPLETLSGQKIDYVFIGSCTNSRLEDIAEVAAILDKHCVHQDVHCIVTLGSKRVYLEAMRRGYIEKIVSAGALVTPPGCGACVGTQGTIPAKGERVLSTMNRNFQGRMGNSEAEIYLSSPLVAANVALHGRVPLITELEWHD
ncbi:3-isopropylmalate dehydratase large subunit [Photorhabdus sp. P32]|uniref:3-isopropylmalate dehydratase large subunit n=1 Tax=Photorhabdus sp. P32 TaxID=3117549 RepID=UPI00311AE5FE